MTGTTPSPVTLMMRARHDLMDIAPPGLYHHLNAATLEIMGALLDIEAAHDD